MGEKVGSLALLLALLLAPCGRSPFPDTRLSANLLFYQKALRSEVSPPIKLGHSFTKRVAGHKVFNGGRTPNHVDKK
jgi:hypothetical protein